MRFSENFKCESLIDPKIDVNFVAKAFANLYVAISMGEIIGVFNYSICVFLETQNLPVFG